MGWGSHFTYDGEELKVLKDDVQLWRNVCRIQDYHDIKIRHLVDEAREYAGYLELRCAPLDRRAHRFTFLILCRDCKFKHVSINEGTNYPSVGQLYNWKAST